MMMPNPTIQRQLTLARRERLSRGARRRHVDTVADPAVGERTIGLVRNRLGHALIGAGSWLSGEQVEAVRPSAHRPA